MTEHKLPLMVLCHFDGRVATADRETISLLGNGKPMGEQDATISQIAAKTDCGGLMAIFESFIAGEQASAVSVASCGDGDCQVSLRRLNGFQLQPLIAVEMRHFDNQQNAMLEIGRATNRLIHDFKNQMGGLKLYAAYLKKRFAGQPEGLEIADKIIHSLNEMTENASLVTRLTRPMELKLVEEDFAALVKQTCDEFQPHAAAREVKIVAELVPAPSLLLDSQQMRVALQTLLARLVELSPEGGRVKVALFVSAGELQLSISNEGETLGDQQLQSFFDFLTHERLNQTSLKLALARRVIELHGGQIVALAAQPVGINILLKFKI